MLILRFIEILVSCFFVLGVFTQLVWPMLNDKPIFPFFRKSEEEKPKQETKPSRSGLPTHKTTKP
jgi:hypothetical protein